MRPAGCVCIQSPDAAGVACRRPISTASMDATQMLASPMAPGAFSRPAVRRPRPANRGGFASKKAQRDWAIVAKVARTPTGAADAHSPTGALTSRESWIGSIPQTGLTRSREAIQMQRAWNAVGRSPRRLWTPRRCNRQTPSGCRLVGLPLSFLISSMEERRPRLATVLNRRTRGRKPGRYRRPERARESGRRPWYSPRAQMPRPMPLCV